MRVVVSKESCGYSAHIPRLSLTTQAEDLDSLLSNLEEAVGLYYEEEKDYHL